MIDQTFIRGSTASEIAANVESALREGWLVPRAQLPTIRGLAAELGISPMTVASAYRELRRRGLVTAGGRRGTRVSDRPPLPLPAAPEIPAGVRDLATGNPDPERLPPLGAALAALDPGPRLYGEPAKFPPLVELARAQFEADGIAVPALAVVGGALDGIERALAAQLRPGDTVAVEDPGFVRVYDLLNGSGHELAGVRVDDFGLLPDHLELALRAGARALVLTPRAQNPTGAALDRGRRDELRAVLHAHPEVLVVEDDHAGAVAGTPAFSLCEPERPHWAISRSVSKTLGPDLRLAVLAGDPTTIARVEGRQLLGTGWVSHVLQELVVALWSDRGTERRLARAAETYSARRAALIEALAARGIEAHGRSGLNVWVPVREETAVVAGLLERGLAVTAGERWRLSAPPAVRITVSTLRAEEAAEIAEQVADVLARRVGTYSA